MEIHPRHVVGAWIALLGLTAVAVFVGRLHLAGWGPVLSIGVASVKALLVIGVFMRLLEGSASPRLVLATAVAMLVLLVSFVVLDVRTRRSPGLVPPDVRPMSPEVGPDVGPGGSRAGAPDQPTGSG